MLSAFAEVLCHHVINTSQRLKRYSVFCLCVLTPQPSVHSDRSRERDGSIGNTQIERAWNFQPRFNGERLIMVCFWAFGLLCSTLLQAFTLSSLLLILCVYLMAEEHLHDA